MDTPYAGAARMLLHVNGKFTMGKLKSSIVSVCFSGVAPVYNLLHTNKELCRREEGHSWNP